MCALAWFIFFCVCALFILACKLIERAQERDARKHGRVLNPYSWL